ncbi:DUF3310 domain-containing protein [Bifidobacterium longum]|uniref:DUF3310 domain-containing protein n=1 Tax=Bifidobacterium longum TaxID=216816 RepID=A0A3D8U0V2_BIFLN|nr:DUF3310 domain-containing protein [Bifidobacterium longum]KAB7024634.1 DUF3310 domain-containing protein [Bifidobacterium longum]KAB7024825.1 DUF3310 domain-containing protein [Bifidobacterium longum]KAB7030996.1 DUF3310 domain-containing protein [Bifidobacterium longum]KAB7031469.1 DUF3310 domain-containing protein [Bifidobacterium longum]
MPCHLHVERRAESRDTPIQRHERPQRSRPGLRHGLRVGSLAGRFHPRRQQERVRPARVRRKEEQQLSNETVTRVGDADPVEHPAHYELSHPGLECIDLTAGMSFCMGNAVKYVWRYRSKNKPVEDLRKALWYTHYAENRNEPVALTCRQLGIINALQHQSQTEQYEFQFWNALRFGDYPKMCRAIALMIRLVEGKNIDDINQELES